MNAEKATPREGMDLWSTTHSKDKLVENVKVVLGAVAHLPIRFWKPKMFFTGARDEELAEITDERFPAKVVPGKSHPVYALKELPENVGFAVCPCTSTKPYSRGVFRFIRKGCRLRYTQHTMDRNSFLVEMCRFNIPRSIAYVLRFKGEVPDKCVESLKR